MKSKMDHELRQRLIGALVVTILSAIFIPMLFDDPIEEEGQVVSNLTLPSQNQFTDEPATKLPTNSEQVLAIPPQEITPAPANITPSAIASSGTLRPDEMDETPKPAKIAPQREKPRPEKSVYSETTNYGVKSEDVDDDPPMKPKPVIKKPPTEEETNLAKKASKPEEELLKQVRAARLLDLNDNDAPVKAQSPTPVKTTPSRWYIQVGSFTKKENATILLEGLQKQGLPALLDPVQTDKGISYRLRVGPELDGKRAAMMKRRMDDQGIKSFLVAE